jgi:TldD protein
VRVEESQATRIVFRGKDIETLGQSIDCGGCVRALVNGGWGFVSFNSLEGLAEKIDLAIRQATLIGAARKEQVRLADVPVVDDAVAVDYLRDPRATSLEEKTNLLRSYNDIIMSFGGHIMSSNVFYVDRLTKLYFANSDGTAIEQEKCDLSGGAYAIASEGGNTQMGRASFGSSNDFGVALGLEGKIREACQKAEDLLAAPVITGGQYTVVCGPVLSGIFAHEAFGHLSEADSLAENKAMQEVMKLGRKFGHEFLSIYDTGRTPGARGYLRYDDEGVATEQTPLIRDGVLVGRLHSRETAARLGERPTGNARAIDYAYPPIVRMRNTCIAPGEASFDDLLAGIKLGVFCDTSYGGETNGEMFTFSAGEAYMIRDGKLAELVRDANLTGNVFTTLQNIDLIGRDFKAHESPGGCGKSGQQPLPTSEWAPAIRIQNVVIGGKK